MKRYLAILATFGKDGFVSIWLVLGRLLLRMNKCSKDEALIFAASDVTEVRGYLNSFGCCCSLLILYDLTELDIYLHFH